MTQRLNSPTRMLASRINISQINLAIPYRLINHQARVNRVNTSHLSRRGRHIKNSPTLIPTRLNACRLNRHAPLLRQLTISHNIDNLLRLFRGHQAHTSYPIINSRQTLNNHIRRHISNITSHINFTSRRGTTHTRRILPTNLHSPRTSVQ